MSRFIDAVFGTGPALGRGIVVGEPDTPTRIAWSEVTETARELAGGLAALGVGRGDRVAVLVRAPAEAAPLVQAVWLRGAAVTMLQQPTPRTDHTHWLHATLGMLDAIDARLVLAGLSFLSVVPSLAAAGIHTVATADLSGGRPAGPVGCAEGDIALLQLSSGSTGTPKAVAITHENLHHNWSAMTEVYGFTPEHDTMVSWLPLFHDFGMIAFLAGPMQSGMDTVCVTPAEFLAAPAVWPELLTRYRATFTGSPNFGYAMLARTLAAAPAGAYDLSALRIALNGGEPIDPATVRALTDAGARFGLRPGAVAMGYGMAEATLVVALTRPGETARIETVDADRLETEGSARPAVLRTARRTREFVAVGRPVPGMGVRVVDETGTRLPARTVGEFQVRGGAVTHRYRTAAGWQDARDRSGWLATGDLGYLTDTGEAVVCGRRKDTIIVAGRNIFPTEVERIAGRVGGVRAGNAAAIRLSPAEGREHFAVIVESRLHDDAAEAERIGAEVARRVRDDIGVAPRQVLVVAPGTLPKTPSGKLRRSAAAVLLAPDPAEPASEVR
ncbi:fatty acyl-AMP ligase [Nocardia mexicana]|uniref:Fatty-acyl-CoA synthase n=1 Tax=Nocardia mexicana TaxID=279262 RepID=A0A370GLM4_9NOCA|nr:fatty acyl-AMP ligase [Nocardia mexicana]RDI42793.1 fatty-acyl-CoA synthase [Nocardia mexicana]